MTNKNQQLKQIIEALVAKEVKRQITHLVPMLVKEAMSQVMTNLISESVDDALPFVQGNSEKRRALTEQALYAPREAMPARPRMSREERIAAMGYGDLSDISMNEHFSVPGNGYDNGYGNGRRLITVD